MGLADFETLLLRDYAPAQPKQQRRFRHAYVLPTLDIGDLHE
jgi:hypothetical protein